MPVKYNLSNHNEVQVIAIASLMNEYDQKEIMHAAQSKMEEGFYNFVVDLADVEYMNSVGLNFLLMLRNKSQESGGDIALLHTPLKVLQLLEMTKLTTYFTITNTLDEAIESVSKYD